MPAPPALAGKRRAEAKRLIASGLGDREIGRKLAVDHKTISRLRAKGNAPASSKPSRPTRSSPDSPAPTTPAPPRSSSPTSAPNDVTAEQLEPDRLLDDDLRHRVALRDRLQAALELADDPRELAALSKELAAVLDGIRRVISAVRPEDDGEEDVEAGVFDAYMLQLVAKGRVIVNANADAAADSGVPRQEESSGEVGDRARANGTDGR